MIRAWRESGLGAREFCEGRGVSANSLYRWSREVTPTRASDEAPELRLVEVVPETGDSTAAPGGWAYEVSGPRGTVRVRDALEGGLLLRAIDAVLGRGER